MGQKVNSNILRVGISKNWLSKYIEKNEEESCYSVYQDLKIRSYVDTFFKNYGILVHSCKINRSNHKLKIIISYLITLKSTSLIESLKIKSLSNSFANSKTNKIYKIKRLKFLKNIKTNKIKKAWPLKKELFYYSNFIKVLLNGLNLYTNNKLEISLVFQNINKGLSVRLNNSKLKNLKNILFNLRFYKKNEFFRESFNVILVIFTKKNSAKLLSEYITYQLNLLKKHNYFLTFLKKTLIFMLSAKISKIRGLKILISGRLNGVPRSKSVIINAGSISSQTLKSNIDYYHSVSFTPNGTLGVKVWVE